MDLLFESNDGRKTNSCRFIMIPTPFSFNGSSSGVKETPSMDAA